MSEAAEHVAHQESAPAQGAVEEQSGGEGEGAGAHGEEAQSQEQINFHKRFAHLNRREKQLTKKQQEIAEREKQAEERWGRIQEYDKLKEQAAENPLAWIEAGGLTYQQITERILQDDDLTPEQKAEKIAEAKADEKIRAWEEKKAKEAEEQKESDQKAKEEQLISDYKSAIAQTIEGDGEKYELISNTPDANELVFSVAESYFEEHGKILDPAVAAEHVEKYLEKHYQKVFNTRKLKSLLGEAPEETQQGEAQEEPEVKVTSPRTLTNQSTVSASSPSEPSTRMMSDEESKAAAAEFLRKALSKQ